MSVAPDAMQLARVMVHEERRVRAEALVWHFLNSVVHSERGDAAAKAAVARRARVENCMAVVLRLGLIDYKKELLVVKLLIVVESFFATVFWSMRDR
jgi:hypothetical protein